MFQLSSDAQFAFILEEYLSLANNNGANTGEILRIATQIVPGDFESFYGAFYTMAEHIHGIAEAVNATKDPVGAREAYFRAASYYRGADFFLHGNWSDPRIYSLWEQQLASFDKAIALLEPAPAERFSLKTYSDNIGDYEAIGVFYKASACNESLPTVLVGNGYDGAQEESYHYACVEILKRGVNCVTYEGPGQPTVRRQQDIGFIPDWWTVASPVMDYLSGRPDVDISKVALVGISFGGTLAPRAASHDDRYSAVVAIDGLFSIQQVIEEQLPAEVIAPFNATNATAFNEIIEYIQADTAYPTELRWLIDWSLFAFKTHSPYDWFTRLGEITMSKDVVRKLSIPVFVAKGQDDTMTLEEPETAYQMLTTDRPNGKALTYWHQFNTSLGAGEHCSIGAEAQLWQVVLGWLSGVWGDVSYANHV
ncbi:hypothetical protein LTR36_000804 [Oleoguttula mirabilis]|uniref:Uncharacterized protein n=1 Tax=Oleoguttula mirabilis TaxID=1507867 RepID=A0AAV9J420_9PEZI|nr:hypothetical protein LTR36_000804 [Oleoguttula mirabilis]